MSLSRHVLIVFVGSTFERKSSLSIAHTHGETFPSLLLLNTGHMLTYQMCPEISDQLTAHGEIFKCCPVIKASPKKDFLTINVQPNNTKTFPITHFSPHLVY